ncbi:MULTISPECIES: glycine cleavage system protein H [Enterococcaceae]|uniref:glycine cleavage system protein H n=1 Tax=Enterococcaceae TaxID=81852 RepID=UPI000E4E73C7|nr:MULTISPECIES: glycine cleavage system protein H [Enterococcaceae]MCI0130622.1 glycine cleavage system protein H [Vagococcus sp. CY53-2]RGI32332.1 glycine cleavage system protein H [Melissococcus sp. OM08-11BH]UNM90045.1 glycine cleavage system protein H [Vagococcus sp. CY52-2]
MSEETLWVKDVEKGKMVGLTSTAQDDLGSITFVMLPKVGKEIKIGDPIVELEAEKAVVEYDSPVSGTIVSINEEAEKNPKLLDEKDAWLCIIK